MRNKYFFLLVIFYLAHLGQSQAQDLLINEVMASNGSAISDEDGDYEDWIEIYNAGDGSVDLEGYGLSDNYDQPFKWEFPGYTIAPGEFLLVWASGKDRKPTPGEMADGAYLHTNFSISAGGEEILLTSPEGERIDEMAPVPIPRDMSYGRCGDAGGEWCLFDDPTPGMPNGTEGLPRQLQAPVFENPGGVYTGSVTVGITAPDEGAEIYYTLNGREPNEQNGTLYTGPFAIHGSRLIRAVCTAPGKTTSPVSAMAYTVANENLEGFSSNLPIMVINQFDTLITPGGRTVSYITIIDTQEGGRARLGATDNLHSRAKFNIRGSSSQMFPKKGYGMHLLQEDGRNNKMSLLGMPEEHNWVLHGPYSDKSLVRNELSYSLSNDIGLYAPRTRLIELFLHDGHSLLEEGHYHGVYLLVERIKIAPGRLDLENLEPHHGTAPEVTGGYIFKKDRLGGGEQGFQTARGSEYVYTRPNEEDITPAQSNYLISYLDGLESALFGPDFKDTETGYAAYLDVNSFIDYHLMVEVTKEIDGFRLSTFFHKDRGGKLVLGPIWDYNLALGNGNYLRAWDPIGWYYPLIDSEEYMNGWYDRLFEDGNFARQYTQRYRELRAGPFSNRHFVGKIRDRQQQLSEAQVRNFQRWDILGGYIWPNWFIADTYEEEMDWMVRWVERRLAWMDQQLGSPYFLVHYWNFNDEDGFIAANQTIGGATLEFVPGEATEYTTGTGQDFAGINARNDDMPGSHLRANNPIGAELLFNLPTTGFEDILFKYETRRSGSGANTQYLSYTLDGESFVALDTVSVTTGPTLHRYDFSGVPGVDDNDLFAIRIEIDQIGEEEDGQEGNNRFDNVTLEGLPMEGTNLPPVTGYVPEFLELVAGKENTIDLGKMFSDPDNDPLEYHIGLGADTLADWSISGDVLHITPKAAGGTTMLLEVSDGNHPPVTAKVQVLCYPEAYPLDEVGYTFNFWDKDQPEMSYPDHMLFLQSDQDDPELHTALQYPYHIPHDDYATADSSNVGFPYRNESRTRVNGLDEGGIAFINTGRGRDLGAAVLAVGTEGAAEVLVDWQGGTVRPNSRAYHIRLQYKVGLNDSWKDILVDGKAVEYTRSVQEGHSQTFEGISLPEGALGQPYVLLRWKYYFTGERLDTESGARDMLRLGGIFVRAEKPTSSKEPAPEGPLQLFPNPSQPGEVYFNRLTTGTVYDLTGKPVRYIKHENKLDTSTLPPGLFFYKSSNGERLKLIVK